MPVPPLGARAAHARSSVLLCRGREVEIRAGALAIRAARIRLLSDLGHNLIPVEVVIQHKRQALDAPTARRAVLDLPPVS